MEFVYQVPHPVHDVVVRTGTLEGGFDVYLNDIAIVHLNFETSARAAAALLVHALNKKEQS